MHVGRRLTGQASVDGPQSAVSSFLQQFVVSCARRMLSFLEEEMNQRISELSCNKSTLWALSATFGPSPYACSECAHIATPQRLKRRSFLSCTHGSQPVHSHTETQLCHNNLPNLLVRLSGLPSVLRAIAMASGAEQGKILFTKAVFLNYLQSRGEVSSETFYQAPRLLRRLMLFSGYCISECSFQTSLSLFLRLFNAPYSREPP